MLKNSCSSSEEDYKVVASRVAQVSLNSHADSATTRPRRRRARKPRDSRMEVDPSAPSGSIQRPTSSKMEVDKNEEDDDFSSFESDSTISSKSSNGKEADDEQSDWVGDAEAVLLRSPREVPETSGSDRRLRHLKRPHQSSIHRIVERYARDPRATAPLTIESKDSPNSVSFGRLLQMHKLEVVKRGKGTVVIAKKPKISGDYDPSTGKGSVVVENRKDLNLVWAALSVFGTHARSRVSIHLSQLTEVSI
uniref:Uncharacterized protein n=1 Tax=Pristionchus pacificus TaxID=54126 RepID=A0A2A6CB74_PRIPA|eukprot:PDM75271.1 hypothetical protein PRIPAC_43465 [Pristionchus pacificus]